MTLLYAFTLSCLRSPGAVVRYSCCSLVAAGKHTGSRMDAYLPPPAYERQTATYAAASHHKAF